MDIIRSSTPLRFVTGAVDTLRSLILPLAVLAGIALAPPAGAASTIEPGYWTYKASTLLTGSKNGAQCVRPENIDAFLSGPHNRHYKCTYPTRDFTAGSATLIGECVGKHGDHYRLSLKGHYDPTTFDLDGHVTGVFLGLSISLPIEITAHRLSADCPVPEK